MSTFGAPGAGIKITKPIPPERGSFPLDHDAECQPIMKKYLACLKSCRMERNLMAPDSMKNLGFGNGEDGARQGQSGEPPEKGK
ncbi:hypothetical protein B0A48_02864 [Cryoendolithus antarcticus]|uniref:Uncharacterized protein n=1 Tax=Cryoendolithus antarcticus TaxID=1507870 RepID=A0A1V8TLG2_9PEZI|nr:hypothetical protein B0A48_02864 [Cryoendolithus antarcticus]